jgi:hypothetical protein
MGLGLGTVQSAAMCLEVNLTFLFYGYPLEKALSQVNKIAVSGNEGIGPRFRIVKRAKNGYRIDIHTRIGSDFFLDDAVIPQEEPNEAI